MGGIRTNDLSIIPPTIDPGKPSKPGSGSQAIRSAALYLGYLSLGWSSWRHDRAPARHGERHERDGS
jgi:hypothetical protein